MAMQSGRPSISESLELRLDAARVAHFRTQGYLSLDAITTEDEIRWLRSTYDDIVEDERAFKLRYEHTREDGFSGIITQIFMPERQCPKLLETTYVANARRLAATLLGIELEECLYGGMLLIYKPAAAGRDTPWHQDEAYWEFPTRRCHSLSVWMPLDDVTVDSGCMQFIPGSQALDVLRYRKLPGVEPLELDEPVDLSSAVACPLAAGGATFHYCRTLHHTASNTSPHRRRALTTIFHGPRTARLQPIVPPRVVGA
jgi:ectoine hydroxylase-related dioxygenase (phytanoyl-CoA dioxygenase family)